MENEEKLRLLKRGTREPSLQEITEFFNLLRAQQRDMIKFDSSNVKLDDMVFPTE